MSDNPTPRKKSYTLSYTRNCQVLLASCMTGVGNVGFFSKNFFRRGLRKYCNIGLPAYKHPYFRGKTSVLCVKEVRCFRFSARKWHKNPLFPILRYFGTRQGVVASEALLSPLTTGFAGVQTPDKRTPENIAHSFRRPGIFGVQ
mgnify:CR=1 FL=1